MLEGARIRFDKILETFPEIFLTYFAGLENKMSLRANGGFSKAESVSVV
jgi:hypothetical protein